MNKRYCYFCKNKIEEIDPTDVETLNHYVSFFGTIEPRAKTKLCQRHHKIATKTIKKSRQLGFKLGGDSK